MQEESDVDEIMRAMADLFRISSGRRLHEARCRAARVDISRTGYQFLLRVGESGPLAVSQLAEQLNLSLPTASRGLRQLEDDGLVVRRADPGDGRVARFEITGRGRKAQARLAEVMRRDLAAVLDTLPEARRRALAVALPDLVRRLAARMPAADRPPHLN